jgi:LPS export ABC transporter protein LptC
MRKVLLSLLVLAAAGAATWYVLRESPSRRQHAMQEAEAIRDYDFEARDVVVRQMGPDGRLQYELEARRFAQSASGGEVVAEDLTIHHDPPGTIPGGAHRWTLTAAGAELPAESQVIHLHGSVRAIGLPRGRRTPMRISSDQLEYDLAGQEVSSDANVLIEWGGIRSESQGFTFNINTAELQLQSSHATIVP